MNPMKKKKKIVLFCKSYGKDMFRARRLSESVHLFNSDNIPLYISVPASDLNQFKQCFGDIVCHFLTDEAIIDRSRQVYGPLPNQFPPDLLQQLIKLEFWRMDFCENYLWLDSDSFFIKSFHTADFFHDKTTPYTIRHHSKDLFDFAKRANNKKIINDFEKLATNFQKLFGRSGPLYNFGCSPLIWSCKVLQSLYEDYLKLKNKTIFELLQKYPCEMQLYGEYLLFSKTIPLIPIDPLFKIYHYADQFFEAQMNGESEFSLSKKYLGIVIQSNWANLPEPKKPVFVRLKNFFGKLGRQIRHGIRSIKNN